MKRAEYNRCVREFSDGLYGYALKMSKNEALAKDLVQESFIKLWENRSRIDFKGSKGFLFKILYNRFVDEYRKMQRNQSIPLTHQEKETTRDGMEERDLLEYAFGRLKEKEKNIILLRDWEGYSYEEIAEILSLNLSQVKVYLFRARKKMKQELNRVDNQIKNRI